MGLFILKKDEQEAGRISHKRFTDFFSALLKIIDPAKTNKGTLTIYPSGEYENSFIWDNEAYLATLFGADSLFSIIYEEIRMCNIFFNAEGFIIPWDSITTSIPFKSGKVQSLEIALKSECNLSYHSVPIDNYYGEDTYQMPKKLYEDIYHLTNEGELKEKLSPKWNVATVHIQKDIRFDFDRDVKFEWREKNA